MCTPTPWPTTSGGRSGWTGRWCGRPWPRSGPCSRGPVPLLLLLTLGELGLLEERQAVRVALWLGVVELVTWAVLYARRQRWNWLTSLTAGAVNGAFGLIIVVLEVVVH